MSGQLDGAQNSLVSLYPFEKLIPRALVLWLSIDNSRAKQEGKSMKEFPILMPITVAIINTDIVYTKSLSIPIARSPEPSLSITNPNCMSSYQSASHTYYFSNPHFPRFHIGFDGLTSPRLCQTAPQTSPPIIQHHTGGVCWK